LQNKKYRKIEHAFLVEGQKNVLELLESNYAILRLFCSGKVSDQLVSLAKARHIELEVLPEKTLLELGTLENNHTALAVAKMPEQELEITISDGLVLALDGINDPGNLGTIIRTADWYGISHIVCSPDTVDAYNPKVVNASKGSFTRTHLIYEELTSFLDRHSHCSLYAACLDGQSISTIQLERPAILLMGNEAHGIRPELLKLAKHKISIDKFGKAESLNVGVATGILLDRLIGG